MNNFRRWNLLLGWTTFLVALMTYILTLEPTVSWWDCGEFIASSYKLLVGHPPGAPLFLMMGRFFTLFAGDPDNIAYMVNLMSALASAFTILFLFWTITHLARKFFPETESKSSKNLILILGSGFVGALAYAFSDTFWFSAVEGEVYATSSLFTAVVFWAILKWENIADQKYADRWLILIAYLMGLSIGVHLLNLLAIPAIVLVYYFRRYEVTTWGLTRAILISVLILAVIMYGIIQGLVLFASKFELLFVNGLKFGFNTGVIVYSLIILIGIPFGIWYTHKKGKVMWNSVLTGLAVILIGYSSYSMIVIRSLANPPMDMNNPENVFSLLSYLNREQYGDRPLLTGHYFTDEIKRDARGYTVIDEKDPVYVKDTVNEEYKVAYRKPELVYDERAKLLPRMYSRDQSHIQAYREWGGVREGEKVHFGNNLRFFISYQLGHMYLRYFMWNFAGRQNDNQSHGSLIDGNWISGIKFLDEFRLGDQDRLPDKYKNLPSRNRYFFLPLILGILGLLFQYSRDNKNFWVVMFLFFFTGIAIVIYLNQTPYQPRERDYAYAGSFYAFSIWIGLGVLTVFDSLRKYSDKKRTAILTVLGCMIVVPGLMAKENWDDHDRSGRYTARDIARNYLNSCEEDAIIFTNGDNDTYPLWYVQEVEGIRTDVRVVNVMLVNSEWNIDQLRTKIYESDVIPLSLEPGTYSENRNTSFYVLEDDSNRKVRLSTIMQGINTKNRLFIQQTTRGENVTVIPTNRLVLDVDSAKIVDSGIVEPEDADQIVSPMEWNLGTGQHNRSKLVQLDILSAFDWDRPIYFVAGGNEGALNLEKFFRKEGIAFRLIPVSTPGRNFFNYGRIDPEIMHENLMNEFSWGRMNEEDVYLDHFNRRTLSVIKFRNNFLRLSREWLSRGDTTKAIEVLDRCMELAPHEKFPYDYFVSGLVYPDQEGNQIEYPGMIETYYDAGEIEKANALLLEFAGILMQDIRYYQELKPRFKQRFEREYYQSRSLYERLLEIAERYGQEELIV